MKLFHAMLNEHYSLIVWFLVWSQCYTSFKLTLFLQILKKTNKSKYKTTSQLSFSKCPLLCQITTVFITYFNWLVCYTYFELILFIANINKHMEFLFLSWYKIIFLTCYAKSHTIRSKFHKYKPIYHFINLKEQVRLLL